MTAAVENKRAEVAELCRRHGVERLDLFGSASGTGEGFDPEESDLDFVVSFERRDPRDLFGRYVGLEAPFGRKVGLVMGALDKSPRFAANVEGSRVPLYGS